jgi:hypothetical protein
VRAEVAEQPATGAGLQSVGVVEIESRMHAPDLAEFPAGQHRGEGPDVGVPATVVVDGQQHSRLRCRPLELARVLCGRCERLVGDDVHAGRDGLQHQVPAGGWWGGDRHRVDAGRQQVTERIENRDARPVPGHRGPPLRRPGDHARELDPVGGLDERGVEVLAAGAVADDADAQPVLLRGGHQVFAGFQSGLCIRFPHRR